MPKVTAKDVAAYILRTAGSMSTMKLQKLLYYCQAWSLVRQDRPLFEDEFEAWAAGPVIRSLFEQHRKKFVLDPGDIKGNEKKLSSEDKKTIDKVIAHYGKASASQLSDLTHTERPWIEAREGLHPTERGDRVISLESMADYYQSLVKQGRSK